MMSDHKRRMLENRRDAAVARRAKLLADIAAVEDKTKLSKAVLIEESQSDARDNHLHVLRQVLRDEDLAIETMNEDLARSSF
jgi:hypothetical protein